MAFQGGDAALTRFLITAKRSTYAGKGGEIASARPRSHDLCYREGAFYYLDTYLGGDCFAGEEAVWQNGTPVFAMNYCGRVLAQPFSGDFLKAALLRVPEAMPLRGPEAYAADGYRYRCVCEGGLAWFQGYEEIVYQETKVYECAFHGGAIR